MKLLVIGAVEVQAAGKTIADRSFRIILSEYAKHFESVSYLGPVIGLDESGSFDADGIRVIGFPARERSLLGNLGYFFQYKAIRRAVNAAMHDGAFDIVQLRIPSVFSLLAFEAVRESGVTLTTYIAGDWDSAFAANYSFPGSGLIGGFLDRLQTRIIRNSIPVTAGPALAAKYDHVTRCYPYRSTTHTDVAKPPVRPPSGLLSVGRLEPLKRFDDGIRALALIADDYPDLRLRIVGDGATRGLLEGLIGKLGLQDRVVLEGRIDDSDKLQEVYRRSDILLHPSVSEGTSKVLAEAMSFGLIPIAVRGVGSNNDIISHRSNGWLVASRSPREIADCIERTLEDEELLASLRAGSNRYAAEHTLQAEVDKLWRHVLVNA